MEKSNLCFPNIVALDFANLPEQSFCAKKVG